jgi:DnaJ-class molecular chaperone
VVQTSVWYDTCHVCQGRGAIPCSACSGIGHIRDTKHAQPDTQPREGEYSGQEHQRIDVAQSLACPGCSGTGAVSCAACHGQGMNGSPSFMGALY